jgi:hypothetical protein
MWVAIIFFVLRCFLQFEHLLPQFRPFFPRHPCHFLKTRRPPLSLQAPPVLQSDPHNQGRPALLQD